ncbi:hypothetical protein MANES_14G137056v8 [Manihot esculenta]|uniref:Uncharacterized protein n=1 Tax=Manihot esculenta TaxID=3983 RepID=A0ACB7GKX0_MANES|nr:hypothetical protein MANES_14G137056v8 [Manihot esculenta]
MSDNRLKGPFDLKELNTMNNLEELDLGGNEIIKFVDSKGTRSLRNLRTLYLDRIITIKGSSTLLESLGALAHLEILDLSGSNFEGATLSLGASTNLNILHMRGSDLKGTRFAQDSNFTNLKELYLDSSSVDENFHQSLETLPSLEILSMQYCGLSGILPVNLGICKLKYLQRLDISYNDISGNLPLCLANLTSLRQLDLTFNHFIGNISSSPLEGLTNLEYLSISDNFFQIPISLSPFFNHSKLEYMKSRDNKIFAETDSRYLNSRFQLERLVLSSGGYCGAFPKFLYFQHNLQIVDLSHNQMREGFPSWLL